VKQKLISIIVPVYNEAPNIPLLHDEIVRHLSGLPYASEFVFVDDGSHDESAKVVQKLAKKRKRVRLIELSRNFGKEAAVSAGLHAAKGDAAIILDADLQHPPELMHKFIDKWERGADVVVGIKRYSKHEGRFKRLSSTLFYRIFGAISHTHITPHASDYRLLDKKVLKAFQSFSERNRMTRGLVDWLGFRRDYVDFVAPPRRHGERKYSYRKLINLAMNNFTAYSLVPLRLAGYIGVFILVIAGCMGVLVYINQILLNDPLHIKFTGTAMLGLMILFLVGVVLACLGLIALYIAHIHDEVVNRPLYVIRQQVDGEFSAAESNELLEAE
jgi:polyisoprenyl-phosphate glycosyltransferase